MIGFEYPEPLASMLTIVTGQKWKGIRGILSPAFTSGKLKGMMYIHKLVTKYLLQRYYSSDAVTFQIKHVKDASSSFMIQLESVLYNAIVDNI